MKIRYSLFLSLLLAIGMLCGCYSKLTPPQHPTLPTDIPAPSEPPATLPPVSVTPQPTEPVPTGTEPQEGEDEEMVGSIYSWFELMQMDIKPREYGCGIAENGQVPQDPINCEAKFGKYGGVFYMADTPEKVYLTFDCGYEYSYKDENGNKIRTTEKILDVLKEKNIKATFFVTQFYCEASPDLVQRMVDEGHALGNHTVSHPNLTDLTIEKEVEEIMGLHDYVKEHYGYTMNLLRPPAGTFSIRSLATAKSLGYASVNWSATHVDWNTSNQPDPTKALSRLLNSSHPGAIYMLQSLSSTNAKILPDLIDGLQAQGYTLDKISI